MERTLPRIAVHRPHPGFVHPATTADLTRVLDALGEAHLHGLKSIGLVEARQAATDGQPTFARLLDTGSILLFEQPKPPWMFSGSLDEGLLVRFREAGAIVTPTDGCTPTLVDWPAETLRDFMIFDVLLQEIVDHVQRRDNAGKNASMTTGEDVASVRQRIATRLRGVLTPT